MPRSRATRRGCASLPWSPGLHTKPRSVRRSRSSSAAGTRRSREKWKRGGGSSKRRRKRERRSALSLTMPPEMPTLPKNAVLVAIDPTRTGFAFAVLEAPGNLIDRGQRIAEPKSGELVRKVDALLSKHYPAVLVLEDLTALGARRRKR